MGALGITRAGPMIYGAARGLADAERLGNETEAHEGDQAIRAKRLENETELQPLRRRALELGVQEGERAAARRPKIEEIEDKLRGLNLDIGEMNLKDKKRAYERLVTAQGHETKLNDGLRKFYQSSEPQHVVDAFESTFPDDDQKGAKATRGDDGSITLEIPGKGSHVFKATRDKAGQMRSADDMFGMFAVKMLNPVERLKTDLTEEYGLAKEAERTDRALSVAGIRGDAAVEAAKARGALSDKRMSEAWYNRQHGQIKGVLDSMLKPEASPSGFAAAYSFDADKALRPMIESRVEAEIETGVPVRRASENVINDVRAAYDRVDKEARGAATALAKAKIKPTDRKAVEAAAQAGNPDATKLLKALDVASKNFGPSAAKFLEQQLPAK